MEHDVICLGPFRYLMIKRQRKLLIFIVVDSCMDCSSFWTLDASHDNLFSCLLVVVIIIIIIRYPWIIFLLELQVYTTKCWV
jgi:NhaP-type Na+/H+ or K+/H+ antiporter